MLLIGLAGLRAYEVWEEGPWELPAPGKDKPAAAAESARPPAPAPVMASTKTIVERNLFDPERGQGRTKEGEIQSAAAQRIRNMALLGTAILGSSRYAILQDAPEARSAPGKTPAAQPGQIRLKLGDTLEGFKLTDIQEQKVVFTRGATKVEVALDFMRKLEESKDRVKAPVPVGPRVPAMVPRRAPGEAAPRERE
ncbi:MAG TPA: hypothetical protein VNL14_05360 [Candidatus Acidoferrales bacterium]|nr:hypothetical protein [Candidatus Acidoferrales bacterium]